MSRGEMLTASFFDVPVSKLMLLRAHSCSSDANTQALSDSGPASQALITSRAETIAGEVRTITASCLRILSSVSQTYARVFKAIVCGPYRQHIARFKT